MMKKILGEIVTFGSYMQDEGMTAKTPIEWVVMEANDSKMLLFSRKVLDCKPFHDKVLEPATWEKSSLRAWLNNEFYNTAFDSDEKAMICPTKLVTQANMKYGIDSGLDTVDKVFVPSVEDMVSTDFGFVDVPKRADENRICRPTEYAVAQGVKVREDGCDYWLRTTGYMMTKAVNVTFYGGVLLCGWDKDMDCFGVRPAIRINTEAIVSY